METCFYDLLKDFVAEYSHDGWVFVTSNSSFYAKNERKVIQKGDDIFFANYYIDIDDVFNVPVFSTVFYYENGQRILFNDFLNIITEDLTLESVSEREHPILHIPVFFVHPCKTAEFVKPFTDLGLKYMNVFVGRYGSVFRYRIPMRLKH